jgi:penicillin amidase
LSLLLLGACGAGDSPDDDSVRIVRDDYGVPHVYSDSVFGLYYGYGYAIAEDRLFQMEMSRRSTQGTVAEVLGSDYVDYDKTARTLFSPVSIRRQLDGLAQEDRDVFEGYAAGVNAYLVKMRAAPATLMPRQIGELGIEVADWTAYDVAMIFIGTMNNRYGDYNTEFENAAILASLTAQHGEEDGLALFELLNPRFTEPAPTSIPLEDWSRPAYDSLAGVPAANRQVSRLETASNARPPAGFSNVYLLGRDKVEGANSILVNGPQFGWFNPSYVYSIGMHGAGIDVVGNTPFGYPMIMFGHNRTIAWGSTWGASDIVDIFAEQINPNDPGQYAYDGGYADFETRLERIAVRDGDAVEHEIHRSVHGPIVRLDRDNGVAYAKQRSWEGRELETLLAWLHATWAPDWGAWKAEAGKSAINVNMYFADVDGNIGYFHGGHFPQRVAGHDNRFPAAGDGSMDWQGRQPVDTANPHVLNPAGGFLANWNNKPGHGVMNPDFFFFSWSAADRVDYLNETLAGRERFTPEQAWAVLDGSSHVDLFAPYFLPLIDEALVGNRDPELLAANALLQDWDLQSRDDDGDGFYDDAATPLMRHFVDALIGIVLQDDLGDVYPYFRASGYPTAAQPTGAGTNLSAGVKAIVEAIGGRAGYDVLNGEPVAAVITAALTEAIARTGDSPLPVAPRPFSTRNFLGIPQAGDDETLTAPLEQNRGTENNMIVMKPDAIVGWEVTAPGQSGFIDRNGVRSAHYDDQFEMYHTFGRKRTWFYPDDVAANQRSETILEF